MKRTYLALAMTAALAFALGGALQAQAPSAPLILKGSPMGAVKFDHKAHTAAGAKCTDCHHASRPEKPMTGAKQQKCDTCHTKVATAPMKTKLQAAFHNPMAKQGTCIDCHLKQVAAGKKAPTKCNECHKKENG
jgi:hypothetical protein